MNGREPRAFFYVPCLGRKDRISPKLGKDWISPKRGIKAYTRMHQSLHAHVVEERRVNVRESSEGCVFKQVNPKLIID